MANFCNKCGSPVNGPFCGKCGADTRQSATPIQSPAALAAAPPPPIPIQSPTPSPTPVKGSPLLKIAIAVFAVIFVFGAIAVAGVWYAAHRVSQKIHEVTSSLVESSSGSGVNSSAGSDSAPVAASGTRTDACRLLSKEDAGQAIGVEIIRTESGDNTCSYIAKGDQADMTAKHATAMMAARGADKKSQQMIQAFAGGMFKTFQNENKEAPSGPPGEVVVFSFSIDAHSAEEQMKLNSKALGMLGPAGAVSIAGIGDEAFASSDSMLMVRKGDKLTRIMYMTCPCGTEAVKPLAKKIADAL